MASDGARDALGGYLYQIVGAAGLTARAIESHDDGQDEVLATLIIEARQSRILHEVDGQDVVLRREGADRNSATPIQYKFSRHAAAKELQAAELRDIVRTFHRCAEGSNPLFPITGYVLVTNRGLGSGAREAYEQKAVPFEELTVAQRRWLLPPPSETPEVEQIFGSVVNAQRTWYGVFQTLTIYQRLGHARWLRDLHEYANSRGVPPEDFPRALRTLVGAALVDTVNGELEFTKTWLNEQLLGIPDARSLCLFETEASAREGAAEVVRGWLRTSLLGIDDQHLVRRAFLEELERQVAQHPIVLVLGGGGCGKSVLAAQFLLESSLRRFVAAISARNLAAQWIARTYNGWRSPVRGSLQPALSDREVLRRLQLANPEYERPILLVDIDGYDERDGDRNREEVRLLSDLCASVATGTPPEMVLIITARSTAADRDHDRRNLIRDLLSTQSPRQAEPRVGVIQVREFLPDEFVQAFHGMDASVIQRLQSALLLTPWGREAMTTLDSEGMTTDLSVSVSSDLLNSLRHPVLWGVFAHLEVDKQHGALDGTLEGLQCLAVEFMERFCFKANSRHSSLETDRVSRALMRIAFLSAGASEPARRDQDWIVHGSPIVTDYEAAFLFKEAVSYGMIVEPDEPGRWTWRHLFLREYLRAYGGRS